MQLLQELIEWLCLGFRDGGPCQCEGAKMLTLNHDREHVVDQVGRPIDRGQFGILLLPMDMDQCGRIAKDK